MAQNWYIAGSNEGVFAPYSPATFKGSWDLTPTAADRLFYPGKIGQSTEVTLAETSATTPFRVCIVRAVSPKLAAQTLAGTLSGILGLRESSTAADFYTKIFIWVTQGDSDVSRGTVVDYEETSAGGATEWPSTATGLALQSTPSVGAVNVQEGDRLVLEFGYRSENSVTTSRTGGVRLGGRGSDLSALADLTAGVTPVSSNAGYLQFSTAITVSASEPTNFTPETATDMGTLPYDSGSFDVVSATYALFWKHTGASGDNGAIGTFAGVSDASGAYVPAVFVWTDNGAAWQTYHGGIAQAWSAYTIESGVGDVVLFQIYGDPSTAPPTGATGRHLRFTAISAPTPPDDLSNAYLVAEDTTGTQFPPFAVMFDSSSGDILGLKALVNSENGAVLTSGIFALTDVESGSATEAEAVIYNPDMSQRAATSGAGLAGSGFVGITTDGTYFYTAQRQLSLSKILICKVDQDGAILDSWDLPIPSGWGSWVVLGISRDASTLYYGSASTENKAIQRWDLVNDIALTDFVAGAASTTTADIVVLRDDTVLVHCAVTSTIGTVTRYATDGSVITAYSFSDPFSPSSGTAKVHHIATTPDDPDTFAIWIEQTSAVDAAFFDHHFAFVDTATNALSHTVAGMYDINNGRLIAQADVDLPESYFGIANSCPLMVLGSRSTQELGTRTWVIRWLRRSAAVRGPN